MQLTCCAHNQLFQSVRLLAAVCCAPARVSASTELLTRDWAPWPAPSSAHQTTATSEPRAELDVISLHTFPFILPRSVNLLSPPSTRPPGAQFAYSGRTLDPVLPEATTSTTAARARAEADRECG